MSREARITIFVRIMVAAITVAIVTIATGDMRPGVPEDENAPEGRQLALDFNENPD